MAPMAIASQNPTTGELLRTFEAHTSAEVQAAITTAHATFQTWRITPFAERAALMHRAADLLDEQVALVTSTKWEGRTVGRLVFLHPRTTRELVSTVLDAMA